MSLKDAAVYFYFTRRYCSLVMVKCEGCFPFGHTYFDEIFHFL